jgi:hypothetical protein
MTYPSAKMHLTQIAGRPRAGLNPLREATTRTGRPHWREVACPHEGCPAGPGQACRKYIAALVAGEDVGGGYWRVLKQPHRDRRTLAFRS